MLDPYHDDNDIFRIGGRLNNSNFESDIKNPITTLKHSSFFSNGNMLAEEQQLMKSEHWVIGSSM